MATVFSAVMVFVVSLLALSFGVLATYIAIATKHRTGNLDPFWIVATIVLVGFGGWGIVSGVGIVTMRKWVRISMLAFGAILLASAVFGTVKMVLDPRVGVTSLEGAATLGSFWLYFFNKNSAKTQFSR